MVITEISLMHHVCIVLVLIWILNSYSSCYPVVYFASLVYLYLVHEHHIMRIQRKLRFEETRNANQRRVLTGSETVRWLNYAIEKIWLVCMEQIVSQKILLPIIPWFLEKYKPWTAKEAVVQHLYLGRNPPMFTEMRVSRQPSDDDHLVLELGMNFLTGDDMSAILAVKLRKSLGFGMWAKLHVTGMHIEGKVLVGVKFLRKWPFLGRLRVCFVEPPYFQMTVKPIFTHGLDVAEFPGIAGWLDKLLSVAFEQTLVEPNMLVVDVEKFLSPEAENWFFVDEKEPIAFVKVELVEGSDMKPSDLNGLADPYIKGQLGAYRFRTKTQKKTLAPKWLEEFKIPICSWDSPNVLAIVVRDKDHIYDDSLGDCTVDISTLRGGQRHDMWLSLQNIKTGRIHVAITVVEAGGKIEDPAREMEMSNDDFRPSLVNSNNGSFSSVSSEKSPRIAENFEPINVEGQTETGIWVHHPGSDIAQKWQPRKGKGRRLDTQIKGEVNSSSVNGSKSAASGIRLDKNCSPDEPSEANKSRHRIRSGLNKFGSLFHRSLKKDDRPESLEDGIPSPYANLRALNEKDIGVKLIMESDLHEPIVKITKAEGTDSPGTIGLLSPRTEDKKDSPRGGMVKQATKKIKSVLSPKGSDKFGSSGSVQGERESPSSSSEDSLPSPLHYPTSSIPISNSSSYRSNSGGPVNVEEQSPLMASVEPNINVDNPAKKESIDNLGGDIGPKRVISRSNTMTKEEVEAAVSINYNRQSEVAVSEPCDTEPGDGSLKTEVV